MISKDPLPDGHTARALAAAMEVAGAPRSMIRRAERGYYHDYLSPLTLPEVTLVAELRAAAMRARGLDARAALQALAADVIEGKHDASAEESDAWARSPEGQATFRQLRGE
jgi:hypothetical protein